MAVDQRVGVLHRFAVVAGDVGDHQRSVASGAAERRRILERPVGGGEIDVLEATHELGQLDARPPDVAALSTSPSTAVTTNKTFGSSWPNCVASTSAASTDSAPAGSNPPAIRFCATPAPKMAADDREDEDAEEREPAAPDEE